MPLIVTVKHDCWMSSDRLQWYWEIKKISRLNWPPRQFKWTRPFRWKTKSGFCACAITFRTCSTTHCSWPIPVAARTKAYVCGRSPAGIMGLDSVGKTGCPSLLIVVCSQVGVSATNWFLVQGRQTGCVSLSVIRYNNNSLRLQRLGRKNSDQEGKILSVGLIERRNKRYAGVK